jgi:hypothetical protein
MINKPMKSLLLDERSVLFSEFEQVKQPLSVPSWQVRQDGSQESQVPKIK